MQHTPPGWYPTPRGMRYWDGYRWVQPVDPNADKIAPPGAGWVLVAAGGLVVVASFLPWASALGGLISKSGIDAGDGLFSVLAGVLMAGPGIAIGVRSGLLPFSVCGVIASVGAGVLGIYEVADVRSKSLDVGAGLWLLVLAAAAGAVASLVAVFVRDPKQP